MIQRPHVSKAIRPPKNPNQPSGLDAPPDRGEAWLNADFVPGDPNRTPEERIARALEYIAYHMGKIDRKLSGIQSVLHR
jgi:hypothetical protein